MFLTFSRGSELIGSDMLDACEGELREPINPDKRSLPDRRITEADYIYTGIQSLVIR